MPDVAALVSQVGFPVALAIYLLVQSNKQTDKYIGLSKQASLDSQASTEAIKHSSEVIQKNTEAFNQLIGIMGSAK